MSLAGRIRSACLRSLASCLCAATSVVSIPLPAQAAAAPQCLDAQGQPRDCSVLIVHSYHPALEWNRTLSEGFRIGVAGVDRIRIDSEYLDAKRRPDLSHAEAFLEILERKYRQHPPDVLVISDDPAFELLWPKRTRLFGDVPIVFMGLNSVRNDLLTSPGVTGIFEQHRTEETVALSLTLTGAEGIIVVNDTSETGRANEETISRLVKSHPTVHWVIERDVSVSDIERLGRYPANWPIIPMLPLREYGRDGPMLSQARSIQRLRAALPQPLFYDAEWLMGSGVVGGYMLHGRDHAQQAGELVASILLGATPDELPIRFDTAHAWIFDRRELERFGWMQAELPAGATMRFVEPSYLERHREVLIPALSLLTLAALVITVLASTVRNQRRAELALRAEQQRLSIALAASDAGVFEIQGSAGHASKRWLELMGIPENDAESYEHWMRRASDESRSEWHRVIDKLASTTQGRERLELELDDGRRLDVLLTPGRNPGNVVGVATDVTRQRRVEAEAASRTRLQALGELAGGIAHDFNNILTVINGTAELLLWTNDPTEIRSQLKEIRNSGARATELVRRLLLFGRKDHSATQPSDLNRPIRDLHQFFRSVIGAAHEVVTLLHDEPVGVPLDTADIEQVLSNLVINARDALPEGGAIRVTTAVESLEGGEWAVLEVQDDGVGMDKATQSRIFEPFFTTKPVGDGSGLGMSTVWGIVSGSDGRIEVCSTPGTGTTITVRWRRHTLASVAHPTLPLPTPPTASRSILVVEDDAGVAQLTETLLTRAGHLVRVATDGREALQIFSDQPDAFDFVFSDLVLPHLSGLEMAQRIRALRPSIRVGFCTGYMHHPSLTRIAAPEESQVLRKPFSERELHAFVNGCISAQL